MRSLLSIYGYLSSRVARTKKRARREKLLGSEQSKGFSLRFQIFCNKEVKESLGNVDSLSLDAPLEYNLKDFVLFD